VTITDGELVVEPEGLHQLWGFKRRIRVPLAHVRGATADPGIAGEPKGLRAPGLQVPGGATIGTFHRDGAKHFWDVGRGGRAVVIELVDDEWARLVVEVADPRATVDAVNRAVTRARR
jgi:hypothetical protein